MKHIVLSAEQTRVVQESGEAVEVRDEDGRTVAQLTLLHPEDPRRHGRTGKRRARVRVCLS